MANGVSSSSRFNLLSKKKDDLYDRSKTLEVKNLERIYKKVGQVVSFLNHPKLGLEVYQPYILETLPDIVQKLRKVWNHYESTDRIYELSINVYFRVFLESFDAKVRELNALCTSKKTEMHDSNSKSRYALVRMSMTLSYLFKDFKEFFPLLDYTDKFKVTKPEPAEWWQSNFQDRILVPWHEFQSHFTRVHPITSYEEAQALKRDIDITGNDHVSSFEFDVFTRLFSPWSSLLNHWKVLSVKHPGYVNMTYEEVKRNLDELKDKPGSYLFRRSCTKLGFWSIGFVALSGKTNQTVIRDGKSIVEALDEGIKQGCYRYPAGLDPSTAPDISILLSIQSHQQVVVTSEEFEIYSCIESCFELCKICSENNKDTRLEPCGHLLCRVCFKDWSNKLNKNLKTSHCPFCRAEVKSTQPVEVQPFHPLIDKESRDIRFNNNKTEVQDRNVNGDSATVNYTTVEPEDCDLIKLDVEDPPPVPSRQISTKNSIADFDPIFYPPTNNNPFGDDPFASSSQQSNWARFSSTDYDTPKG